MVRRFLCVLVTLALGWSVASADITVGFNPVNAFIPNLGGTADVQIVADIPEADAIVGWGLDLTVVNPAIVSWTLVGIGPQFDPVYTPDGDGLAGLVPLGSLWGNGILLATVQYTGLANGTSATVLSDNNPIDLTEGFALMPPPPGMFAIVHYLPGTVISTPEPASVSLLAMALLALRRR